MGVNNIIIINFVDEKVSSVDDVQVPTCQCTEGLQGKFN